MQGCYSNICPAVTPQLEMSLKEMKALQQWLDGSLLQYDLYLRSTILFKLKDTEVIKHTFAFQHDCYG